ncbi:MAG TPA: hypothetical protein VE733_28050 [Streptosporangiaceae bacterium]|nr:hypothetical protein [Streptosporangiaceae bacterium]
MNTRELYVDGVRADRGGCGMDVSCTSAAGAAFTVDVSGRLAVGAFTVLN